jgi:cytochrome P450 PksS
MIGSLRALENYLRRLFAQRRTDPRDDLITALVQAEQEGDTLSPDELVAMVMLLLIAGHETTVNLIGNGTLALLEHHDQKARFIAEPDLLKTAVEELLRYDSPVEAATDRFALEDVTIAGTTIPKGALALAVIASANRDERQFSHPDVLDIARADNRHLAFGQGIHYCLGAPLARLEGHIALRTLFDRLPTLHLAVDRSALRWRPSLITRGLESLPATWTRPAPLPPVTAQHAAPMP